MTAKSASSRDRRELQELQILLEISRLLDSALDLREVIAPVLQIMQERLGMLRGIITLVNRDTGEIVIEGATGMTEEERRRGVFRLGEGVTGKVVETGRPVVVPRVSEEPRFLNRATASAEHLRKKDISFICVPIRLGNEVIGALSVDRLFDESVAFEEDVRLLSIIASLIAQAMRLRQMALEDRRRLLEENLRLQEELKDRFHPANLIGTSKSMRAVFDLIGRVCQLDTTVLIRGASGTGKELVAQAIHYNSPRATRPFIKVNCAALPEPVLESELFGHEKGAFTGAIARRLGRFELADSGTIFLDEIGDLPPQSQIRLLRVLQEREFERVGGTESVKVDVSVLAATNRDLEDLIAREKFRSDLYYRLNVFPISLPPLRERRADILLLADHFVEKFSRSSKKSVLRISTPAIDMLMAYHWPGNVRELENCIERAVLLSDDGVIHSYHLPPTLQTAEASGTTLTGTLEETLDRVERELILDALKSARGNMAKAARQLGISERLMGLRVRKFGIEPKRFRTPR